MPITARCETCVFFQEDEKDQGECHRYPPVLLDVGIRARVKGLSDLEDKDVTAAELVDEAMYWYFPVLMRTQWCGEWKGKM